MLSDAVAHYEKYMEKIPSLQQDCNNIRYEAVELYIREGAECWTCCMINSHAKASHEAEVLYKNSTCAA